MRIGLFPSIQKFDRFFYVENVLRKNNTHGQKNMYRWRNKIIQIHNSSALYLFMRDAPDFVQ